MVEEAVEIIMTMTQEAVEITIETEITTTTMKVIVTQVREYALEKHVMQDSEILTVLHQTQKIETLGTPATPTSAVVTMKTIMTMIQLTTQNTVGYMCHGHKNLFTVIKTILISYNATSKEISSQC